MGAVHKLLMGVASIATAHLSFADEVLPPTDPPFKGEIGSSALDSIPAWPQAVKAPNGAPNIVLILLDDVGFGATSTFGGPVETPELDSIAAQGLRYNRFHVSALCSPTRAALLSGRNDHRAGFGQIVGLDSGFPGYTGIWRKNTVMVADVLRRNGYSTAAFGKWHNTPESEVSPAGPFERWPTGLGFEYFYGFMGGLDSHWEPSDLYRNTIAVEPSATPEQGYHLTTDLTDDAVNWIRTHQSLAPDKPYFLYFATGATHSPHHVSKQWIERYRGRFDQGWDKLREEIFARQKRLGVVPTGAALTQRPKELRAWSALSQEQQKLSAREMEVFAAFLAHTDHEVGRLLEAVRQGPQGDNTLILYIVGDNGAEGYGETNGSDESEGLFQQNLDEIGSESVPLVGPHSMTSAEWAWATNTPFPWTKWIASHLGGTRSPLVVSWPARIANGGVRSQYTHANDVAATLYEVTGIPFPSIVDGVEQQPLDGISFAYSFDDPHAPSRHRLQIFEQAGNRAIYQDGWLAGALHMIPWMPIHQNPDFKKDRWELYHLDEDFSQAHDLAKKYPDKLNQLQAIFDSEARKNNVYPLLNLADILRSRATTYSDAGKQSYVYYSGVPRIPAAVAPQLGTYSYIITADVNIPNSGAEGVILSFGGRLGGFALYVQDGHLIFENRTSAGSIRDAIISNVPLSPGKFALGCQFVRQDVGSADSWDGISPWDGISGTVRLYINSRPVGKKFLAKVVAPMGPLGIGRAFGSPVSSAFRPPFKFTGTLEKVTVQLQPTTGSPIKDMVQSN